MSRMIDRLERDGLVRREACEEDGRGAEVALTDAGRELLAAARASHLRAVRAGFLEHFDDDELAASRTPGAGSCRPTGARRADPEGGARRGVPDDLPVAPRAGVPAHGPWRPAGARSGSPGSMRTLDDRLLPGVTPQWRRGDRR